MSRAFHAAKSGRPGPVVLGLPEDMLSEMSDGVLDAKPARLPRAEPSRADMAELAEKLKAAQRPLFVIGGPGWSRAAQKGIEAFAKRWDMPVASAFRFQDYMDNRHSNYVGCVGIGVEAKLGDAVKNADVLVVVGARMGEATSSNYTLLEIPNRSRHSCTCIPRPTNSARSIAPTCPSSPMARRSSRP